MLISGERGLYTRLGNARSGRYLDFTFQTGQGLRWSDQKGFLVRLANVSDTAICSQLYQAEPVHYVRKPELFSDRLQNPNPYINANSWIIRRYGRGVAYLFLGIPWDFMDQPEAGIVLLVNTLAAGWHSEMPWKPS